MTTMRWALVHTAAMLSLVASPVVAQLAIPAGTVREASLSFDGRATAGAFTGTTTTVTGEMTGGNGLSQVRGWVEVPVNSLKTGNGRRDRDLNKSMESEKYPTIRFELTGVEAAEPPSDSMTVTLQGRFIIHGVTRETSLAADVTLGPDGVRVRGTTPLNLKDYEIGGLTKMMGMLKMHEEIVVHVDLVFEPAASPAGQARSTTSTDAMTGRQGY
jgi:polyisoprenoid-binding protein YceI